MKKIVIVLVVLLLAIGGYFAWLKWSPNKFTDVFYVFFHGGANIINTPRISRKGTNGLFIFYPLGNRRLAQHPGSCLTNRKGMIVFSCLSNHGFINSQAFALVMNIFPTFIVKYFFSLLVFLLVIYFFI